MDNIRYDRLRWALVIAFTGSGIAAGLAGAPEITVINWFVLSACTQCVLWIVRPTDTEDTP